MISTDYRYLTDSLDRRDRIAHAVSEVCAWVVLGAYTLGVLAICGGVR